jgi:hypothetical protein
LKNMPFSSRRPICLIQPIPLSSSRLLISFSSNHASFPINLFIAIIWTFSRSSGPLLPYKSQNSSPWCKKSSLTLSKWLYWNKRAHRSAQSKSSSQNSIKYKDFHVF